MLLYQDPRIPLFVFDAGYDANALGHELSGERVEVLCRIRDDRVFCDDPPPHANRPASSGGRPPWHGKRMKCSNEASWRVPDATCSIHDERYGSVRISAWHGLHPRLSARGHWARHSIPLIVWRSVIRVDVEHLNESSGGVNKSLWLWWSGEGEPDSERCARAYLRCFDIGTAFGSKRGPWDGRRRLSAPPSRLTAGPGSSSQATPSSDWPVAS
ncbi:MAG: transposase [Acidimicrobiales bacterium]